MNSEVPELAYYYPNWIWSDSDWLKNLIIFFDGVALLVPRYMRDRPSHFDPSIVEGLEEHGLITILEPEEIIDHSATEALSNGLADILASGALDELAHQDTRFYELSYSRLGYYGNQELARKIYEDLKERGLAKPSEDGVSIPMHPMVRTLILVLLAQIIRPSGNQMGVNCNPTTDHPKLQEALRELLDLPIMPSSGNVVSLDLQTVGVDLSGVPIDEVLGFRNEYGADYRRYTRNVRRFVQEISQLTEHEQEQAIRDRRAELAEESNRLHQLSSKSLARPVSILLGISGAAWTLVSGDIISGMLAMGAGTAGAISSPPKEVNAFSYLVAAERRFS